MGRLNRNACNLCVLTTGLLVTLLLTCSCRTQSPIDSDGFAPAPSARQQFSVAGQPPGPKEILQAVFANLDVPLTVDPSCRGAGTSSLDQTIGDYLAGFLAEFESREGRNWIETHAEPAVWPENDGTAAAWKCELIIRRSHGEEEWGWGVRFWVLASSRTVVRDSFRCLGAG